MKAVHFPRSWLRKLIEQAKSRDIEWAVTEDDLWDTWMRQRGVCPLSGLQLVIDKDWKKMTASVDRMDSSQGYVIGNVWFIHKHINMMKYKFGLDYFVDLCCKVAANRLESRPVIE